MKSCHLSVGLDPSNPPQLHPQGGDRLVSTCNGTVGERVAQIQVSGGPNRLAGETVSSVYCTLSMVYVFILQVARYDQNIWSRNSIVRRPVGQSGCIQMEDSSNCIQGSSSQDGSHVVGCTL